MGDDRWNCPSENSVCFASAYRHPSMPQCSGRCRSSKDQLVKTKLKQLWLRALHSASTLLPLLSRVGRGGQSCSLAEKRPPVATHRFSTSRRPSRFNLFRPQPKCLAQPLMTDRIAPVKIAYALHQLIVVLQCLNAYDCSIYVGSRASCTICQKHLVQTGT